MASLSSFLKQRPSSYAVACHHTLLRRLFSTATSADSPSLAQKIRDLPKDLPGNNIKKNVFEVLLFSDSNFCYKLMRQHSWFNSPLISCHVYEFFFTLSSSIFSSSLKRELNFGTKSCSVFFSSLLFVLGLVWKAVLNS